MTGNTVLPQTVIDLYDEYTHAPLDRRVFLKRLASLAGSTAAAYALLPLLENNYARAGETQADDKRLKSSDIVIAGPNGDIKGYLTQPIGAGRRGSVLVIHENRGLNPYIRDVARRVALAGYNALALDFLSPLGGTPQNEDEARAMFSKLDPQQTIANGMAALAYLKALPGSNGRLGVLGFCWGGAMVNQLALSAADLDAAVSSYGMAPASPLVQQPPPPRLHYAGVDERINASWPAYEAALKAAGIDYLAYVYKGAQHAFYNDTNAARYDKAAADLSWERTLALFRQTL